MQTGHELFVHGLNDMMDGERQLTEVLEVLAGDSSRAEGHGLVRFRWV